MSSSSSSTTAVNGASVGNGNGNASSNSSTANGSSSQLLRQTPLTCSGHTRPVVFLAFSEVNPEDEAAYYCISACKGEVWDI